MVAKNTANPRNAYAEGWYVRKDLATFPHTNHANETGPMARFANLSKPAPIVTYLGEMKHFAKDILSPPALLLYIIQLQLAF